jgi:hypothetical protein
LLERLALKGSLLSPEDIRGISDGLALNKGLRELNLYGNYAYKNVAEVYGSLARAMQTNRCLEVLKIAREEVKCL